MVNAPKLRFEGFTAAWEQRKLSDIYKDIGNAFVGTATPYYVEEGHFYLESNNIKDGQINHNTEVFINDEFYEKQKEKWLHTGYMVMVQSGHVGHAAVIPEELDCSAAHALIMFRNPKVEIEPYFLNYQYQTTKSKKKIENITTGNTIKHILASEMQEFVADVTSYGEQKKIAGFFRDLDNLITLHQRKCDALTKAKTFYLQNLFPQEREKEPKLRLEGYTDTWNRYTLGDLYTERNERGNETLQILTVSIHTGVSDGALEEDELGKSVRRSEDKTLYKHVYAGDLIFNMMRAWQGAIGVAKREGMISPAYISAIPDERIYPPFMNYLLRRKEIISQINNLSYGVTDFRKRLYWDSFIKVKCCLPSVEEQKSITDVFEQLDTLITRQEHRIKALKTMKKFMLQNMFPQEG